ncbi:MAG: c-type cytochrome biogenesis protein CcmI [Gammaproteobacteria bacterium]|nr:c-type cytochrome biogenesis protein CcmI [Gammaproteobacteria bacterium]
MMTTNFWIAIAALLAIALVIIWWPYFRNTKLQITSVNSRSQANKLSYRQSRLKLEQQLDDQLISQAEFETLSTELGRKLIQDEATQEQQLKVGKRTMAWPVLASILTVALSTTLYLKLGALDRLTPPTQAAVDSAHSNMTPEQQQPLTLQQIEQQVAQDPTNSQLLYRLAHAYVSAGQFDKSVNAFNLLIELEGEHAEFIGPQAQALYYKNEGKMTPAIIALTQRALTLDPEDTATLVLLGMDSFSNAKYADAAIYWQRILNTNRPGIDRNALTNAIAQAKERLSLTGETLPQLPKAAPTASLKVNVSISDELKGQYDDQQTVFIYAIPVDGARMPLAAIKLTAGELPTDIVLDDSLAMTPAAKISDHQQVKLFAVISKTGSAGIKPGDLQGFIDHAALNSEQPYLLTIDTVVK